MALYENKIYLRGRSSAGRAPHWQCGGHRFDPDRLHHIKDLQFGEILPLASLFYFKKVLDKRQISLYNTN